MPDFETAIVKLRSSQVLYEAEGFENKGIGNATNGSAPVGKTMQFAPVQPQVV